MFMKKGINQAAFTLVEIMIVVAIIGLLAAIAIPNFVKARATSQANACINNLRQIDGAAQEFALENHKKTGDAINFPSDLTPYIKLNASGSIPPCPAGGTYADNAVGNNPTCSLGNTVTPAHVLP
jgi:prepilin-type N-terminal cleavage/methylation domain-containing protein